jgi:hypothetical protein
MANMVNEEKLTPEHREMMESLITEQYDQVYLFLLIIG